MRRASGEEAIDACKGLFACRSSANRRKMAAMNGLADFASVDGGNTLRFSGDLSLARLGDVPDRLAAVTGEVKRIDLSQVERIDTVGAWIVHRFARDRGATIEGLGPDGQHLLDQVAAAAQPGAPLPPLHGPLARVLGQSGGA